MYAIYTHSDENLKKQKAQPQRVNYRVEGEKCGARKRGDEQMLGQTGETSPWLFFLASVKLGVTPGVGKKCG